MTCSLTKSYTESFGHKLLGTVFFKIFFFILLGIIILFCHHSVFLLSLEEFDGGTGQQNNVVFLTKAACSEIVKKIQAVLV